MGAWAIALHGGAGMIAKQKMTADWQERTEAALNEILDIGIAALENHLTAVEAVELVVSNAFPRHPSEIRFGPPLHALNFFLQSYSKSNGKCLQICRGSTLLLMLQISASCVWNRFQVLLLTPFATLSAPAESKLLR